VLEVHVHAVHEALGAADADDVAAGAGRRGVRAGQQRVGPGPVGGHRRGLRGDAAVAADAGDVEVLLGEGAVAAREGGVTGRAV
jgi:hypothetical protein